MKWWSSLSDENKKKLKGLVIPSLVCVIALGCMSLIPNSKDDSSNNTKQESKVSTNPKVEEEVSSLENELELRLKSTLSEIKGAGSINVLVTLDSSEELQPAFNSNTTTEETTEKDSKGGERTTTTSTENKTMITSGTNDPIITKTLSEQVKGVVVVSSGASNPEVKETLYNVVQKVLQIQGYQVEIVEGK